MGMVRIFFFLEYGPHFILRFRRKLWKPPRSKPESGAGIRTLFGLKVLRSKFARSIFFKTLTSRILAYGTLLFLTVIFQIYQIFIPNRPG